MEAAPPTYAQATTANYLTIVASDLRLSSRDLYSATLVCHSWHSTFAPLLWGNPSSHFNIEDDSVFIALARFRRKLHYARLLVRSFTHTLHLPPAHPEQYDGPRAEWLHYLLNHLPNLQSLIVRGLPFFDYSALEALKFQTQRRSSEARAPAVDLQQLGSSTITVPRRLNHNESLSLRLLDASRCPNVTPNSLATGLAQFEQLLYLDLSFTVPARDAVVLRSLHRHTYLQVLKLRGIGLKDDPITILSQAIRHRVRSLDVRDNLITDEGSRTLLAECTLPIGSSYSHRYESVQLAELQNLGSDLLGIYHGEDYESYLRNIFTKSFVGRLAIEDLPERRLTHLYITNNKLSLSGELEIIQSATLQVLDVCRLANGWVTQPIATKPLSNNILTGSDSPLVFLRADYRVVTTALLGSRRLTNSPQTQSFDIGYERETKSKLTSSSTRTQDLPPSYDHGTFPTATQNSEKSSLAENGPTGAELVANTSPFYAMRNVRLGNHLYTYYNLHPAMLPHLRVLVLTEVPQRSISREFANCLIRFIQQCAEEAHFAVTQANRDYSLPPGRTDIALAIRHASRKLFALEKVVLELAPDRAVVDREQGDMMYTKASREYRKGTISPRSNEDAVFSMFRDEQLALPLADSNELDGLGKQGACYRAADKHQEQQTVEIFDTVALLSAFRRDRKEAHLQRLANGESLDSFTDGYWNGILQVVRPGNDVVRSSEEKDYHSSRFRYA